MSSYTPKTSVWLHHLSLIQLNNSILIVYRLKKLSCALVLVCFLAQYSSSIPMASSGAKIDPELLEKFESVSKVNIFIEVNGSTEEATKDINETTYPDRGERITALMNASIKFTETAQNSIKAFLTERYFSIIFFGSGSNKRKGKLFKSLKQKQRNTEPLL